MNRILCLIALVLSFSQIQGQENGNGQNSFQILQVVGPARVAALGGNNIAVKDGDLNLGMITPSLLDSSSDRQIALGFSRLFGEATIGHAAYAHNIKEFGMVSFSINSLTYGEFDLTDETGQVQGSFNAGEYLFQAGLARQLTQRISLGANVKFFFSELAEYKSNGVAVDLSSTYYKPEKGFTATLMMRNIGSTLKEYRSGVDQSIPFEIQAGFTKKLLKAPLRFGIMLENLQKWDLSTEGEQQTEIDPITGEEVQTSNNGFGENLFRHVVVNAEIIITKNFHLRVGYNYNRRQQLLVENRPGGAGLTYGLGLRISKFHLSYGRATYSLAGASNHFTLSVKFDDFKKS